MLDDNGDDDGIGTAATARANKRAVTPSATGAPGAALTQQGNIETKGSVYLQHIKVDGQLVAEKNVDMTNDPRGRRRRHPRRKRRQRQECRSTEDRATGGGAISEI